MAHNTHVVDSLPSYALGALDADELAAVESHLESCASCRAELREISFVTDDLLLLVPAVDPPPYLRQKLMAQVSRSGQLENTPLSPPPSVRQQLLGVFREHKLVAASQLALLLLALVFLTTTVMLWNDVSESRTAQQPGRMSAMRLNSTGVIPAAEGYLTLSGDRLSGAITLDQLPELGESGQYQLWLVKGGVRTGAALLSVDEKGYGGGRVHAPEPLSHYSAAEVTIEPAGGSAQPTSDVILTAELPQD